MSTSPNHILLGDIGATNARLALLSNGAIGPIEWFRVAEFERFGDAVSEFLKRHGSKVSIAEALLAVAGPVADHRSSLTNCHWTIDGSQVCTEFRLTRAHVLNDFEATAHSLPQLTSKDLYPLGGAAVLSGETMAVLGPGTGLGIACLVPASPNSVVIAGEGGHVTMAPASEREDAVLDHLRKEFGHVSAERVISGMGIVNLYQAVRALDQVDSPDRSAAEITNEALEGACPASREAVKLFCAMLGTIAGNVALTFGARGGVYIAGGIAPRLTEFLARSEFRTRFESKGRLRTYLTSIPTNVIMHPAATFVGLRSIATHNRNVNGASR